MSARAQRAIKALLLLATAFFLFNRVATGTLYYYISERFGFLTLLAILGLVAVAISYRISASGPPTNDEHGHLDHVDGAHVQSGHQHHGHAHEHDHHDHHHSHGLSWSGVLLVALPVLLGLLVPPRPLGVSAMDTREMNLPREGSVMPAAVRAAAEKSATTRTILDWWTTFQTTPEMASLVGQEAQVTGFVYQATEYPEEYFIATRFVVSCCAADASVVGLLVHWPQAPQLEDDQWVVVAGNFVASDQDNWQPPILQASSVTVVDPPQQPYLYP